MPKEVLHVENSTKLVRLHMAIELSNAKWKVGFCSDGPKLLERNVDAGDLAKVRELICWAKQRLELPEAAQVVSCYEAGREGFMPHRQLEAMGVRNVVVDPASIEVDRRARRKKTDRIDLVKLLANLVRHHQGAKVWSVCRVPTPEQEDARRLHREHQRLTKERTAHQNRMRSLLKLHGITLSVTTHFLEDISALALPFCLHQELEREYRRWQLVNEQMHAIELEQRQRLKQPQTPAEKDAVALMSLKGIGQTGGWVLAHELFWRRFNNRRQLAACIGLTPSPWQSGSVDRDQGISKAGNPRVRALLIELSWQWLRYQPQSALSKWFVDNYGKRSGRLRRVGIVAVARRLVIALWRLLEHGELPQGAVPKVAA